MKTSHVLVTLFAIVLAVALTPFTALARPESDSLRSPSTDGCTYHTVIAGETLTRLAARYGVTAWSLTQINNISNPNRIYAGQTLLISCPVAEPGAAPTAPASRPPSSVISSSDLPRVTGAISTDSRHVKISFSETMNDAAIDRANYSIVQEGGNPVNSRLVITGARFLDAAHTVVELTTLAQDEIRYQTTAVSLRDRTNQPLAPKQVAGGVVVDPSTAVFQGSPPTAGDLADADGDTLSDTAEQRGWGISVILASGDVAARRVTSDPGRADTDGDTITDAEERAYGTDPRSADTDGDQLTDYQELVEVYSDPAKQDSDGDGLNDGLELNFFKTSPNLKDTDGDQFTDDRELFSLDRSPLLADLPRMQIFVGDARMALNVKSSYTDDSGKVTATTEALQTTLGESREQKFSTSNTVSNETTLTFGQKVGAGIEAGGTAAVPTSVVKKSFEATFGQSLTNGFTATASRETAETANREYQNSVSRAFTRSENRSVTRSAESAEMVAAIGVQNQSNIAFTIRNIELSVLQQDRRNANRMVPIAALRLEGVGDLKDQPAFNLGPFDPQRGPFIFKSSTIFPSLVEQYMREPQGLIYRVVNFDLTDEFGRNFVFSNQDVNDHTVGITIDYGDGETETYRVATHNLYDAEGKLRPITMQQALQIIGIARSADPTGDTPTADPNNAEIRASYGTQPDPVDGVEVLTRVRGVQTDFASPSPEKRFWAIISANREVPLTQGFSGMELRARDDIQLVFTRDVDRDQLLEREEIFFGSSDTAADSDGDSLNDFDEVRSGWSVKVKGTGVRKVFPSPAMPDSDLDGLTDDIEKQYGTDPTQADTDFDGLTDAFEIRGPLEILLHDGDADQTNNPILLLPSYSGPAAIVNGLNPLCETTAAGDDTQEVDVGQPAEPHQVVVSAGANGVIDTQPNSVAGGDDYVRVAHDQEYLTDPLSADTDLDGITDGREVVLGINPNRRDAGSILDSDDDGLTDDEEDAGWQTFEGGVPAQVTSSKLSADTDRDGLPDVYERAIGTNPRSRDTDGDTLFDMNEFDPLDPIRIYDSLALADAKDRCADAKGCQYTRPDSPIPLGTDPRMADTDSDGLTDVEESTKSKSWHVWVFNKAAQKVTSDEKFADQDQDGLNDGAERINGTDPKDPDTDGDGRKDGLEVEKNLNPLRKDYHLKVTLTDIVVGDDCDPDIDEGMELEGKFWLRRLANTGVMTETLLLNKPCYPDLGGCQLWWNKGTCCTDARPCPGDQFTPTEASNTFVFREGESFILGTNELLDVDDTDCNPWVIITGRNVKWMGSFTESFTYEQMESKLSFSREVKKADDCRITINYAFKRVD